MAINIHPWVPEDGDTKCQACWAPNVAWWVEDGIWNAVMPNRETILCLSCFAARLESSSPIGRQLRFELVLWGPNDVDPSFIECQIGAPAEEDLLSE